MSKTAEKPFQQSLKDAAENWRDVGFLLICKYADSVMRHEKEIPWYENSELE